MARTRKASIDNEKITDTNIARVIKLLNPSKDSGEKAITKKTACEILGMAYNTTRLGTIISQYEERIARDKAKRAEKRGKPASTDEIGYVVKEYLNGETIDSLSKSLYRSTSFVKAILERNNVPLRQHSHNYFKPELLPEGAVRSEFNVGEIVYSARYDSTARIDKEYDHPVYGKIYRLWLLAEEWQQYCNQPACELGSLAHLKELGIAI